MYILVTSGKECFTLVRSFVLSTHEGLRSNFQKYFLLR